MGCDDPINATKHTAFNLKQDTPYDPVTQALDPATRAPIDITGYTFDSRFLDKEGGTILDEAVVTIVGDPTNGTYKELLNEAENNALVSTYETLLDLDEGERGFWEFFATKDGTRHKWATADVGIEEAGEPAP